MNPAAFSSFFSRQRAPYRVQRFRCCDCGRYFSTQTFVATYWLKRPDLFADLFQRLVSCSGYRQIARCLEISPLYDQEAALALVVQLTVDPEGSSSVTLQGSLGDARSDACVEQSLETATAVLPHGTRVTFSLELSAR